MKNKHPGKDGKLLKETINGASATGAAVDAGGVSGCGECCAGTAKRERLKQRIQRQVKNGQATMKSCFPCIYPSPTLGDGPQETKEKDSPLYQPKLRKDCLRLEVPVEKRGVPKRGNPMDGDELL